VLRCLFPTARAITASKFLTVKGLPSRSHPFASMVLAAALVQIRRPPYLSAPYGLRR
jgi:hypothetical protein